MQQVAAEIVELRLVMRRGLASPESCGAVVEGTSGVSYSKAIMNQRAMDELRHRTGMDRRDLFYLWAIPLTLGMIFLTWFTFRHGIGYLLVDPQPFLIWVICMMVLVSHWRARPRKRKQDEDRR